MNSTQQGMFVSLRVPLLQGFLVVDRKFSLYFWKSKLGMLLASWFQFESFFYPLQIDHPFHA